MHPEWRTYEMLLNTEAAMHAAVRKEDSRATPPLLLVEEERDFWLMQFRMVDEEVSQKHHVRYTQSVMHILVEAFKKLGYKEPELESEILLLLVEGFWRLFLTGGDKVHFKKMLDLLKRKYAKQEPLH